MEVQNYGMGNSQILNNFIFKQIVRKQQQQHDVIGHVMLTSSNI